MLREAWMLAIEALSWMDMQKISERFALAKTVKQLEIRDPDTLRLAHLLVYETVRRRNTIDRFIDNVLKPGSVDEFSLGVQAFLRLYVYQTRVTKNWSKIDVKEAENVASIARYILGWKTIRRVEPVLGKLLTEKPSTIFEGLSDDDKIGFLSFHPAWFVNYCFKLFGRTETTAILEANTHPPPTYIRLNTLGMDVKEILEKLGKEGIEIQHVVQLKYVYRVVSTKKPLTTTASFKEGLFYIQDKASCFAAEAADPKPKMIVLDVCAAPGAKTAYLAQLMQNLGLIYSVDYSKRRMMQWKIETANMGVKIAVPIIADARNLLPLTSQADIVVLDPPCTSTGAFGKSPSAKWRLTRNSIDKMAEIQWQMLCMSAEYVKPKGVLIYSTCSITVEENEMLIERFLKWRSDFSLTEIVPEMGLRGLRGMVECRRLYPHIHQCNGFFIAKLLRNSVEEC